MPRCLWYRLHLRSIHVAQEEASSDRLTELIERTEKHTLSISIDYRDDRDTISRYACWSCEAREGAGNPGNVMDICHAWKQVDTVRNIIATAMHLAVVDLHLAVLDDCLQCKRHLNGAYHLTGSEHSVEVLKPLSIIKR